MKSTPTLKSNTPAKNPFVDFVRKGSSEPFCTFRRWGQDLLCACFRGTFDAKFVGLCCWGQLSLFQFCCVGDFVFFLLDITPVFCFVFVVEENMPFRFCLVFLGFLIFMNLGLRKFLSFRLSRIDAL